MRKKMMTFLLCACTIAGSTMTLNAAEQGEKRLVGVATIFEDAGWASQVQRFEEEIGPALNMEFVFSDKLNNTNELTDFMTQAIAMGCDGIINFVTQNESVEAGARLAEDNGIWYVTQNSMINEDVAMLEHNLGHIGASAPEMEKAYHELVTELIREEGRKGFFIYTGSAAGGNLGTGALSHFYSVKGVLEAIAEAYEIDYQIPIEDLINNTESSLVETGRADVFIYLSSTGVISEGMEEAKEQMGTGNYDTLLTVTSYTSFTNITAEAERAFGNNVMIAATVSDDQMTEAGFAALDITGDTVLHAGIVNPLSIANAQCALFLRKGFDGAAEEVKEDGHTMKYEVAPWVCHEAVEYDRIKDQVNEQIGELLQNQ